MSSESRKVTGGDLESLWKVAHRDIPTASRFYADIANKIHDFSATDTDTFGPCHAAFSQAACTYEQAVFKTGTNLRDAATGLSNAIQAYQYTDNGNGEKLTDAGKDLSENLKDDGKDPQKAPSNTGQFQSPNHATGEVK